MAFIIYFFLKKFEKIEKTGIISTKLSLRCTPSVILGIHQFRGVVPHGAWGAMACGTPRFWQILVNPISIRGADYTHQIILAPSDCQTFLRPCHILHILMGDVKTPQITLHVHIIVLNVTYISRVKLILDGLKSILNE